LTIGPVDCQEGKPRKPCPGLRDRPLGRLIAIPVDKPGFFSPKYRKCHQFDYSRNEVSRVEVDSMAKNEAEGKVLEKVRGVEKEQGSFAEAGSEPPPHYGHGSAKSPGVAGNKMPGGKKD